MKNFNFNLRFDGNLYSQAYFINIFIRAEFLSFRRICQMKCNICHGFSKCRLWINLSLAGSTVFD